MAPARTLDLPATGVEARLQSRTNELDVPTCGVAPGYLQANLIVLPSKYAQDFEILCARNPVPCPLLAKSTSPGDYKNFTSCIPGVANENIAKSIDIRHDTARFNIYVDGELREQAVTNVEAQWKNDHVAFLIGCSYSFETALTKAGLMPPHVTHSKNVAMYRSNIPLCPAGIFQQSTYVVSMRLYRASEVEQVRSITRPYVATHGEPVAWGWDGAERIGIKNLNAVDWGDAPVTADGDRVERSNEEEREDGFVPVFWGCGVTPQEAVMRAKIPGVTMGHAPGYMVILDVKEEDVLHTQTRP